MPDIFKHCHPARTIAALLCMRLFLACLGLLAWASNKGATVTGPVHITANPAHVLVALNDEILVLDPNGALQERHLLKALGIDSPPDRLALAG